MFVIETVALFSKVLYNGPTLRCNWRSKMLPFRQFGWMEILIILLIVLLIFGPSKLPQLAKSIGKAIREFRQNLSGEKDETLEQPESEKKED